MRYVYERALTLGCFSLGGCPRIVVAARASENFVKKTERAAGNGIKK